ncbi:FAD-dependent oxidoreductase [Natronorubrum sp. JWXQ-INN-674]|uniref:FAD-dependent oxidoreductase n=1 Tax=Natronorubrum halalkaliphilum TaxID=2691917 RepID=A0A6B0VHE3_9EURY|nr:FAD-binding oxidoreductase [Natronorubrum halalkaliphilum]MXV60535.1 FAD-dependent oxidoreductase [Natronorubrum halalkaliphilum]
MTRETYDVILVGGGIVGISTAYHLSTRTDLDVALFEADRIGGRSTGRSAGGIRQQFATELEVRLAMESVEQFGRFAEETDRVTFSQNGYLLLARTDEEAARLRTNAKRQRQLGLDVRELAPETLTEYVSYLRPDDIVVANYCPTDGVVEPHTVTRWLSDRTREAGATVREQTPVTGVRTNATGETSVIVGNDEISAEHVIVAGGVWSERLFSTMRLSLPVDPTRIQIVVTDHHTEITEDDPFVIDLQRKMFFRPEGGSSLLVSGQHPTADAPADIQSYNKSHDYAFSAAVSEFLLERTTGLEDLQIATGWAGLKGVTPDGLPLVGPVSVDDDEGLIVATGFNGHGFMLAPAIGRALSEYVVEGTWTDLNLEPFSPTRFDR